MTKSSYFLEYVKLHLTSLNQDLEAHGFATDELSNLRYHNILGQIEATKHLLSVAFDIMKSSNERYNNE